ncbi:type II toxin-antitoxin system antitoxin SocA domain-containing protein [Clostridium sp. YIM B02506]|uniref:Panacea domain-containing protein n=1 Tax=Clostridium sp. YIM B02506 TaxID=2910680 RepID=UPI001EEE4DB1|nr:type II toxin-antitoxin system antitoxin SocA domain-containing protein [Clostridium sp. YIM B02506]
MYQHIILMCSDYRMERRIAFHKSYTDVLGILEFEKLVKSVKGDFRNVTFSFHHIITESVATESIADYDAYFKDVYFYSDIDAFKKDVAQSIEITPEDIVKGILVKKDFDQLQIQKLLYFVYSEYAKEHDEPLFEEAFEAWTYGPVIPSVYDQISKYKRKKIVFEDKELEKLKLKIKLSRVYDSQSILECIDKVIEQYGNKTGMKMVDETHVEGSPWYRVFHEQGTGCEIPLEMIKEYVKG